MPFLGFTGLALGSLSRLNLGEPRGTLLGLLAFPLRQGSRCSQLGDRTLPRLGLTLLVDAAHQFLVRHLVDERGRNHWANPAGAARQRSLVRQVFPVGRVTRPAQHHATGAGIDEGPIVSVGGRGSPHLGGQPVELSQRRSGTLVTTSRKNLVTHQMRPGLRSHRHVDGTVGSDPAEHAVDRPLCGIGLPGSEFHSRDRRCHQRLHREVGTDRLLHLVELLERLQGGLGRDLRLLHASSAQKRLGLLPTCQREIDASLLGTAGGHLVQQVGHLLPQGQRSLHVPLRCEPFGDITLDRHQGRRNAIEVGLGHPGQLLEVVGGPALPHVQCLAVGGQGIGG